MLKSQLPILVDFFHQKPIHQVLVATLALVADYCKIKNILTQMVNRIRQNAVIRKVALFR